MKFDIQLNTDKSDDSNAEIFKSWRSFSDVFEIEKRGMDLIVKAPDEFFDWLGETTEEDPRDVFLAKARNALRL